jgi:hypothetical protein
MGVRGQRRTTGGRKRRGGSGGLRPQTSGAQQIVGEGMEQHDAGEHQEPWEML